MSTKAEPRLLPSTRGAVRGSRWRAGKNLVPFSLYDAEYAERCRAVPLSDGVTWCVPNAVEFYSDYSGAFADPQCSRPLVEMIPPDAVSLPTFRFALVFPPGHSCNRDAKPSLYSALKHSGVVYDGGAGSCYPRSSPTPGSVFFEAGTKMNPSEVVAPQPPQP